MKTTALVTGASSGIGMDFSRLLAQAGHDLVIVARSGDKLRCLKSELESRYQIQVLVLEKDLSEINSAEWVFSETQKLKIHVDLLINNAGIGDFGFFTKTQMKKEEKMILLNILTLTKLTKFYAQEMVKVKSGKILNVASTAAFQAGPLMAVYFASKSYVLSFTEALANEFKGTGVSITALCPGPTTSGFMEAAELKEQKIFQQNKFMPSSLEVARFGIASLYSGKTVAVHGLLNKIGVLAAQLFPRKMITIVLRLMLNESK